MHRKLENIDTDGAVTTFAVVAASAGAELGAGVILILG